MAVAFLAFLALVQGARIRGTTSDATSPTAASLRAINGAAGIPLPSPAQLTGALAHQFTVFMHWSMCTFTGCQWNLAVSPAQDFTPPDSGPNATQWALTAKNMGATQICLTVRHVGGFSLWPTASTNYSVAASAWRNGTGDVVREFVEAVRAVGISPCLYIILGFNVHDAHANVSGPLYLERQVIALTELLTNYGQIDRLWWDNVSLHPSCKQGNLPHPILSHSLSLFLSLLGAVRHWVLPASDTSGPVLPGWGHHLHARPWVPGVAGTH